MIMEIVIETSLGSQNIVRDADACLKNTLEEKSAVSYLINKLYITFSFICHINSIPGSLCSLCLPRTQSHSLCG